jgi:hypothetical protein
MNDYTGYYTHKKTGDVYAAIGRCKIKRGDLWVGGVVYMRNGKMFSRGEKSFRETFTKCIKPIGIK